MITLSNVRHRYAADAVVSLPDLTVEQGGHQLVLGLSGSGKSTLLHIVAGVLTPTEGEVTVAEQNLRVLKGAALDRFRGRHIGIVFQQMHLLNTLTVEQNLLLAPQMAGLPLNATRARDVLAMIDMEDYATAYPNTLSMGQQQRVALARAVMNDPDVLLVDEPTASLDPRTSRQIMRLISEICAEQGLPAIINIHDVPLAQRYCRRIVGLRQGRIVYDGPAEGLSAEVLTDIYGAEDWEASSRADEGAEA